MKYLKIDTVIDRYINFTGHKGSLDRVAIKQFAEESLRQLEIPEKYVNGMSLIYLKDGTGKLPDYEKVVELAYYNSEDSIKRERIEVVEWTDKAYDGCDITITKDCPKCHTHIGDCECEDDHIIYEADEIWRKANADLHYRNHPFYLRTVGYNKQDPPVSLFNNDFQLMRPTTHSFFNVKNYVTSCRNLDKELTKGSVDRPEYKIHYDNSIEVNRDKGQVLFSYLKPMRDKEGYRMIPNVQEVFDVVKWNVLKTMHYRNWNKATLNANKSNYRALYMDAKREYNDAFSRAYEVLNTPEFREWVDFIEQNYLHMFKGVNDMNIYGNKQEDVYRNRLNSMLNG